MIDPWLLSQHQREIFFHVLFLLRCATIVASVATINGAVWLFFHLARTIS